MNNPFKEKKQPPKRTASESVSTSRAGMKVRQILKINESNEGIYQRWATITAIVIWILAAAITTIVVLAKGTFNGLMSIIGIIISPLYPITPNLLLSMIGFIASMFFGFWWYTFNQHQDIVYDEDKGIIESTHNDLGSATRIKDGPEKLAAFKIGKAFLETDVILGRDIEHPNHLLHPNPDIYGSNKYILALGYPGCGKSRCIVIPNLFQIIRRGESCIITDTKASLYGYTKLVAEAHGYETRFINFDPTSIGHSDSVNLFTPATKSDLLCATYAKTIIENLQGGVNPSSGDYWTKAETNLLTAAMLCVKNDTTRKNKSLSEVVRVLDCNSQDLINTFNQLKTPGTEMTKHANTWINTSDRPRDDTHAGLMMSDLTMLTNPVIDKVTSGNDVDMTLPGRKKCIYYVNLSDSNRSLDFLSALFFKEIISELESYADSQKNQKLKVPVTLFFEEFANIGVLSGWSETMNTIRSRGITPIMILQCLEQLKKNYGDDADAIHGAVGTQILLGTNLPDTAKYFSERCGKGSVVVHSKRWTQNQAAVITMPKDNVAISEEIQARDVYTLDEIYRIRHPRELVVCAGFNSCEMERVDMLYHPMVKEVRKIDARRHIPNWVRELDPIEYQEYGIDINDYAEERDMLIEAGYDPDAEPYKCTERDFKEFKLHDDEPKARMTDPDNDDDSEKGIVHMLIKRKKVAEKTGKPETEVKGTEGDSLDDMFGDNT